MNEEKLHALAGSVLKDLGGAFSVPLVQIGESLGIYEALNEKGSCTSSELEESWDSRHATFMSGCVLRRRPAMCQ